MYASESRRLYKDAYKKFCNILKDGENGTGHSNATTGYKDKILVFEHPLE